MYIETHTPWNTGNRTVDVIPLIAKGGPAEIDGKTVAIGTMIRLKKPVIISGGLVIAFMYPYQ